MTRNKRLLITVLSILAIVSLAVGAVAMHRSGWGPGRMGFSGRGYRFGMMGGYGYAYNAYDLQTNEQVLAQVEAAQADAQTDEASNSIRYTGDDIRIVLLAGPEWADEKFVVNGLVNPTLYVPKGAAVTLVLVNQDEGMPHAFEVTNAAPPYYYMAMMSGGIYPGSFIGTLPEAKDGQYPAAEITFSTAYAGTYYYICQYPGHAQEGMYGTIVIE